VEFADRFGACGEGEQIGQSLYADTRTVWREL
jgi:hypothetical protein